jgi:hypothetical protein
MAKRKVQREGGYLDSSSNSESQDTVAQESYKRPKTAPYAPPRLSVNAQLSRTFKLPIPSSSTIAHVQPGLVQAIQ